VLLAGTGRYYIAPDDTDADVGGAVAVGVYAALVNILSE
jgi:hypothetical protein